MTCETTLVVEYDENGKRVSWNLKCEGDCPSGHKCKMVNFPSGKGRTQFECACKQDGDGDLESGCKLVVFMHDDPEVEPRLQAMCLGHCPHTTVPCRLFVVKKQEVAPADAGGFTNLDKLKLHTIVEYKCFCPDDII